MDPFWVSEDSHIWTCETCGKTQCNGHRNFLSRFSSTSARLGVLVVAVVLAGVIGFILGRTSVSSTSATTPPNTLATTSTLPTPTSTSINTTTTLAPIVLTTDEKQMIDAVNKERMAIGLSPLEWCPTLASSAKAHSVDMATRDFYDHVTPEGVEVWDRAKSQGYNYSYVGENIAVGQKSVKEVMIDWMDSKGHRENILLESYTHFGYGKAKGVMDGDPGYIYWTQNFGSGGQC